MDNIEKVIVEAEEHRSQGLYLPDTTPEEEAEYRQWARDKWNFDMGLNSTWHPIVLDEIKKMIDERMNEREEYVCILEIRVEARNDDEAAEFAWEDIHDAQLGHWNMLVRPVENPNLIPLIKERYAGFKPVKVQI